MTSMHTDAAVLASEAANFDRISGELTGVKTHVDAVAGQLATHMHSEQAGLAAQAALARFDEAMTQQLKELADISANIQTAGVQYTSSDADAGSSLANQMHI
ncbi:WXG100 family type VII secretion target [Mycolicibacterium aubagnense]|uniref:ESAT-6-like protein EsxB n=2 Tax=Mycolicibacterium TaxID=1866885 RepID=A0ABM7IFX3_9MYCO|nr:WXG100 family type VII secretion target [Mycolicibacterium aubagnense]BBX85600.1 ESAT-6-like protein EsxB [Mycolicibacterium aubagnense]